MCGFLGQIFNKNFVRKHAIDFVLLISLSAFGLYLIRGIFTPGFLYQVDNSQHFEESVYVATVLLPRYHSLIGWNPDLYLGWPQGQFNPPASYLIYSVLYYILSPILSPLTIFKLMLTGFFLFQGYAIYFAAKGFGLSKLSAFVGGFISIGTVGGFELGGPVDIMYYGMYEFATAVAMIPLVLAIYHQSIQRNSLRLVVIVGILVAFDFLLHTLAGTFLIITLAVYTIAVMCRSGLFNNDRKRVITSTILKFAIVLLIFIGISSFWIVPAVADLSTYSGQYSLVTELGNFATTYNDINLGYIFGEQSIPLVTNIFASNSPNLTSMLYSNNQQILASSLPLFYQLLISLVFIGAAFSLLKSKSRFPILCILITVGIFLFLSLGPGYYGALWKNPSFQLFDLRPARAAAVPRIFFSLLAGASFGESFSVLSQTKRIIGKRKTILKIVVIVVLLLLGLLIAVNSYELMNQVPIGATTSQLPQGKYVPQLFSWLRANIPNGSRVAYEGFLNINDHLFAAAPIETGLPAIGSTYPFWWQGADDSLKVSEVLSSQILGGQTIYQYLEQLNTKYFVIWTQLGLDNPSNYPNYFGLMKQVGPFYVYELKNFTPNYVSLVNGTGNVNLTSMQPEQINLAVKNVTAGSELLVKVSYFSNWIAYSSNGVEFPIKEYNVTSPIWPISYMLIPLKNSGSYNISLTYGQPKSESIGESVSDFSLVIVAASFFLLSFDSKARLVALTSVKRILANRD